MGASGFASVMSTLSNYLSSPVDLADVRFQLLNFPAFISLSLQNGDSYGSLAQL